ncbi:MAG TPA: fumarylacetoacetate hydrolase family protein [Steroidobacteraceae bacterium]|nr:fumarylacetoacetate hydrolase family protein [Steroidobacteraceae bacterium]
MSSRREFLKTGAAATGVAAASASASAATGKTSMAKKYSGPHEMPTGVTLLAMRNADGSETLGAKLADDSVLDVRKASQLLGMAAPATLEELLREGNARGLNELIAAAQTSRRADAALVKESSVTFGRLFVNPGKIVCIGLNYRAHAAETNLKLPSVPILFNKYNNALAAHNCTITLPPREVSYKFDYETELLIVMGRSARNVSEAEALDYVAGYCTSHDFSARDLQLETPSVQWMIGKTLDNFGPIGPYFVSADRVGDPNNLRIETYVNGERRQSSNTSYMIFNPQKLIAYISRMWTLEPGDIIWSGTPEGVILGYPKEKQVWLKAGDEIVSTIEKLGTLRFKLA